MTKHTEPIQIRSEHRLKMLMTTDRPVNKKPATDKSNGINAAINSHRHVFREEKSFCRDWKPTLRQEMKDRRLIE